MIVWLISVLKLHALGKPISVSSRVYPHRRTFALAGNWLKFLIIKYCLYKISYKQKLRNRSNKLKFNNGL